MLKPEEIESWNEIFPDCKLKQSDLTNPTEAFLTKSLILYLRKFGYDVQLRHCETDNIREQRLFLIKLTQHIDHILKLTDKSYTFSYFDLIHPTPKKTSHMLGILLNFLYFYNMYNTNVFTKVSEVLNARNELLKRVEDTEQENQRLKLKSEKMKENLQKTADDLPRAKEELSDLRADKAKQTATMTKLKEELQKIELKLDELKTQKHQVKKRIVPDSAAKELQDQQQNLQQQIDELKTQEAATKKSLKERVETIKTMQALHKDIEGLEEMLQMRQLAQLKESDKKLKSLKNAVGVKQQQRDALQLQLEEQKRELKSSEEMHKMQKSEFQKEKLAKQQEIVELEKVCQEYNVQIEQHQREIHTLNCLFEEQLDIKNYLQKNIGKLFYI